MALKLHGIEIQEALERKVIRVSLKSVDNYDGDNHRFVKGLSPNSSDYDEIGREATQYGFSTKDSSDIVRCVLDSVGTDPTIRSLDSIVIDGENSLERFAHIRISESNNGVTDLLFLKARKSFYVIGSNRSTLLVGNVLEPRTKPLNCHEVWEFDIYSDVNTRKPFVPEEFNKYEAWFKTKEVKEIEILSSPKYFSVIDEDSTFGGRFQVSQKDDEKSFGELVKHITQKVDALDGTNNGHFPEYDELLSEAKSLGIHTYTLNSLIESIEKREKKEYVFTEGDWHVHKTQDQIREEKEEKDRKNKEEYERLKSEVEKEASKIHRKKVALFFEANGVISKESKKYVDNLAKQMDELAKEEGYGTPGYAESRIKEAEDSSKKRPGHNLKVSVVLLLIVALLSFTGYSWWVASASMEKYDGDASKIQKLIDEESFSEAREAIDSSQEAFRPTYLSFLVSQSTQRRSEQLETAIDNFVKNRLTQIETLVSANNGVIDPFTWSLIKQALELRPNDKRLNELRMRYIRQL